MKKRIQRLLGIEPVKLIEWNPTAYQLSKRKCKPLNDKQISILKLMINNHEHKGIEICSCDVSRVLQMDCDIDDELPTRLEGSD